jgi:general secretion pathway protein I
MRSDRGFTLLEVLVAFVIAALALSVLFRGALTGLRSAEISGPYQEAVSRARSHLAAVGRSGPLIAADQQGDDGGGFHWDVRVAPRSTATPAVGGAPAGEVGPRVILYGVRVTISWRSDGGERRVQLDSDRVGLAAPPPP